MNQKSITKFILGIFLLISSFLSAQNLEKNQVQVSGACSMCKTRIEATAKKAGASNAIWDEDSQMLNLQFDANKTSKDKILKAIADVGHDNELYKASDVVYQNLPECCHYDRTTSNVETPKEQTQTFLVKGNCSQCETRIENAALKSGATSANWDSETQTLNLEFNSDKTSSDKILKAIADVGHDNERFKAPDKVYKNLPDCCLYDRNAAFPEKVTTSNTENKSSLNTETENHSDHQNQTNEPQKSQAKKLEEVKLTKIQEATTLKKSETSLTFDIGEKELLKAACCNLSESFETNATVDVSYSNAVTGTKQLKMLGLDQKYTYITKELLPDVRGLAIAYGLNFIPGRWISGIQLTKGGSTVTNGYESITGQINAELVKFSKENSTSLNFFIDQNLRTEANIVSTKNLNETWGQSILIHGNGTFANADYNKDGFLDQPKGNQINLAYLLDYNNLENSGWASHFGVNAVKDTRIAGQKGFISSLPQADQNLYGVKIDLSRFQIWNKTGYIFKDKPYQSIGWMNQFTNHQQNSFFGYRKYNGKENSFYSNLIFESIIGNTNNKYKVGASFLYDYYNEDYQNQTYKRTETVPGVFAEYTLTQPKFTLVAGVRTDFHNLAGTQFTPRINFKYDVFPKTILRLSMGRGFRTANIFAENQQYFASNRTLEIIQNGGKIYGLKPEIAWNYGASLQQEFKVFGRKSTVVADFFNTNFQNQILVDLDASPQKILFYNLDGKSYANSFQTQWDFSIIKNLDVRLAYKYYDVKSDYKEGRLQMPFLPKNRGFVNLAYATNKKENGNFWSFDTTLNWVGKQRLPNTSSNPIEFRIPSFSKSFVTINAQVSKNFNQNIRLYLGGENLTSVEQKMPIIEAQNPFGNYFDASMVYAPIMPANFYLGLDVKF